MRLTSIQWKVLIPYFPRNISLKLKSLQQYKWSKQIHWHWPKIIQLTCSRERKEPKFGETLFKMWSLFVIETILFNSKTLQNGLAKYEFQVGSWKFVKKKSVYKIYTTKYLVFASFSINFRLSSSDWLLESDNRLSLFNTKSRLFLKIEEICTEKGIHRDWIHITIVQTARSYFTITEGIH